MRDRRKDEGIGEAHEPSLVVGGVVVFDAVVVIEVQSVIVFVVSGWIAGLRKVKGIIVRSEVKGRLV